MPMSADFVRIKTVLNRYSSFLKNTYYVKNIGVFGSYARGDSKKASDIDLLVEFSEPIGFFRFIELEEFLSKVTGKKVDLVTKNALKEAIRDDVLKQVVYV